MTPTSMARSVSGGNYHKFLKLTDKDGHLKVTTISKVKKLPQLLKLKIMMDAATLKTNDNYKDKDF